MEHGWCEQVGEVKLTREQFKEYWSLLYALDMQQYSYKIYRQRLADPEMAARDEETIKREGRQDLLRKVGMGVALVLAFVVPILIWGYESVIGVLGAIGILYWLFKIFGWLLLPMIGGVFGFGVSAHRQWRAWQFGRRH